MSIWMWGRTYVERLPKHDPARFGLDLKIFDICRVIRRAQSVHYRAVIIGVFVGRGHSQYIRAYTGVLFYILHVFLQDTSLSHLRVSAEIHAI